MKLGRKFLIGGKISQLVVLALLVSLTLSACQWPWEGPTPAGAVPSETSLTSVGGRIEVAGAQVQAEGGTAPEGTRLKGAFQDGELPEGLGDAYEAASKPLRIELGDGLQPQKPLTVTIPVDTTKLDGFDPSTPALALLIITEGQEKPDIVRGTWNSAEGTLTAQVPHLSLVQALFFNVDKWIKGVEATVLQSLGIEYPKPGCADQPVTIAADTYSAESAWAEWTCLSSAGNSLVVSAHSNSPIPFMVKSAPTVPGRVTTDFSRSGTITTALANQLGYTGSTGEAVMFPGGSVEFKFDKPAAGVSLSFQELPTILLLSVLTQALDQAFDKFGQKLHLDALSKLECWKNILETSLNPQLDVKTASGVVKSALACVGEMAELTVVGEVVILLISAAPAAFAGMFLGAATSITGQANFNVTVQKSSQPKTFSSQEMGGLPNELSGTWCTHSTPQTCFSAAEVKKGSPEARVMRPSPSTQAPGATDYVLCLKLDLGDHCTTANTIYLRYFPAGATWNCVQTQVVVNDWPACQPDYTSSHDSSQPRLLRLPNHQQSPNFIDSPPMYRTQ